MNKVLALLVILSGCTDMGWCPEEFEADLYTSGLCIKTNGAEEYIDLGKIEQVLSYLEESTFETFPDKRFDIRAMLTAQPVLLGYWGSVAVNGRHVRGFTVRPQRIPEEEKWLVKYPEIHVQLDYCQNLYYVTGHEILHMVAYHHLGATREENSAHMPERIFLNWLHEHDTERENTVEGKFTENVPTICGVQVDNNDSSQDELLLGDEQWEMSDEDQYSPYGSFEISLEQDQFWM